MVFVLFFLFLLPLFYWTVALAANQGRLFFFSACCYVCVCPAHCSIDSFHYLLCIALCQLQFMRPERINSQPECIENGNSISNTIYPSASAALNGKLKVFLSSSSNRKRPQQACRTACLSECLIACPAVFNWGIFKRQGRKNGNWAGQTQRDALPGGSSGIISHLCPERIEDQITTPACSRPAWSLNVARV